MFTIPKSCMPEKLIAIPMLQNPVFLIAFISIMALTASYTKLELTPESTISFVVGLVVVSIIMA